MKYFPEKWNNSLGLHLDKSYSSHCVRAGPRVLEHEMIVSKNEEYYWSNRCSNTFSPSIQRLAILWFKKNLRFYRFLKIYLLILLVNMIKLSHNPATFLNGYISMMRNVFLTSSVALGTLGYSLKSKYFSGYSVKIVSLVIIVYSISYGLKSATDFNDYLTWMEKNKEQLEEPYRFQIPQWKGWITLTYVYVSLLIIVCLFLLYKLR
jgi:hypothetical protein